MNQALLVTFSNESRKTVIKDYNLPIPVYKDTDAWLYFYTLYCDKYDIDTIANSYYEMGQLFNFDEKAVKTERHDFYENMIKCLEARPIIKVPNLVVGEFPKEVVFEPIYNEKYNGRMCISIDMKAANYSIMAKYYPDNVKGKKTYVDFASLFTKCDYLKNSKHIREKIFGKVVGGKFINLIKKEICELINFIYMDIRHSFDIVYNNNDDIVLVLKPEKSLAGFSASYAILTDSLKKWEQRNGIQYNQEYFILTQIPNSSYYIKEKEKGKFDIKNCPIHYTAQVLKAYQKLPLEKFDMMFSFESNECLFLEPLFEGHKRDSVNIQKQVEPVLEIKQTQNKPVSKPPAKTDEQVLDEAMRAAGLKPEEFYNPNADVELQSTTTAPQPTGFYDPNKDNELTSFSSPKVETGFNEPDRFENKPTSKDSPFDAEMKKKVEQAAKDEEMEKINRNHTTNIKSNTISILSSIDKWNSQ